MEIYGIGPVLLKKIKPLLKGRKFEDCYMEPEIYDILPDSTKAFMKYKPLEKIKSKLLLPLVKKIEDAGGCVAGSFRRGTEYCRDIDILIKKENITDLHKSAKFTKPHAQGEEIIRCFVKINQSYIFADIFIYTDEIFPFMLLYATGSKQFNKNMRGIAKSKGYKLNQHGLYKKNILVNNIATEEDIFAEIKMAYLEPYQRNL